MLLVDKYIINDKKDVIFHKDEYRKLLKTVPDEERIKKEYDYYTKEDDNRSLLKKNNDYQKYLIKEKVSKFNKMSNILIHGYNKSTLVKLFLQEIYGPVINKLETESYKITGYGNMPVYVDIQQSTHHIVIDPHNTGIDKYIIQEVVKKYAMQSTVNFNEDVVPFNIVLIKNVDCLSYYAQTSLRYTMETYYKTCKFILCASQLSKILDPLRSRCIRIRLPKPTEGELFNYIYEIAHKENISIHASTVNNIIANSNRDVNTCLWWLEYYRNDIYDFTFSWKTYLQNVVSLLHYIHTNKQIINISTVVSIRLNFNTILITNITGSEIMLELLSQIITKHPEYNQSFIKKIVFEFQKYEARLPIGTRIIMHLEALIMSLFKIFFSEPYIVPT